MTSAEILESAVRIGQVDLFDEYFSESEQPEVLTRTRKARELGFLTITDEGLYELTAKGSEHVARAKALAFNRAGAAHIAASLSRFD